LFCPVATNVPDATTAPSRGAVAAHRPKPSPHASGTPTPSTVASHQVGNDVVIGTDSFDSITLSNVDLATLHPNDFVFV
jgi:hypothetical protein